jgi:hypothetical protein
MKWNAPHFNYEGVMCGMAAFKQHCAFGFWKAELVFGRDNVAVREALGHFGRITKVSDLPDETTLIGYVRKAVKLNEKKPQPPKIPDYFAAAWRKMLRRERYSRISARAIKGNTWSGLPVPNATRRVSNEDIDRMSDGGKGQKLEVSAEEELDFTASKRQSFNTRKAGRLFTSC